MCSDEYNYCAASSVVTLLSEIVHCRFQSMPDPNVVVDDLVVIVIFGSYDQMDCH